MALLPEGITDLLHQEKLPVLMIKCQNVIILAVANVAELENEWTCLTESTRCYGLLAMMEPFVSKHLATNLSGVYRKSRNGSLIVSFEGKKQAKVGSAIEVLCKKFHPGEFSEID